MPTTVQESLQRVARSADKPLNEYKDAITRELCNLTGSTLSYFATMDSTETILTMIGWSMSAMMNCSMIDKPIVYQLSDTGLWGDAMRERKPVVTNDYKNLVKDTKKGYPQGHVNVRRHMNIPIFEGRKVAMVVGVGNKTDEYTLADAKLMDEFMSQVWPILRAKL
jgi:hypothetical protein